MKELLLKKKSKFILYILALFATSFNNQSLVNFVIALLIGSIQVGSMDYFIKTSLITIGVIILGVMLFIISRFIENFFL